METVETFEAKFLNTATSSATEVFVTVPSFDHGERPWGPVVWSPRPGPVFPKVGEKALLVVAPSGQMFVTEWQPAVPSDPAPLLSGPAGGVLSGTYPNPGFAVDMATQAELDAHVALDATTTVDGHTRLSVAPVSATAPIAAGDNDPRLTNARTPTAHAASHQPGGSDALPVDAAATTGSLRTLGTGTQQAAAGSELALKAPLASPAFTGTVTVGGDTNLYRSATDLLKTDDMFEAVGGFVARRTNAGFGAFESFVGAETTSRWIAFGSGRLEWGPGAGAARDTTLYRGAADQLRTDDGFFINHASGLGINVAPSTNALVNLPASTTVAAGGLLWGTDTNIYRSAADTLKTDDAFHCLSLTQTSDESQKTNVTALDPASVLNRVNALAISEWEFRDTDDGIHIGPMAQDFYEKFETGTDNTAIRPLDVAGVALASIQALTQQISDLAARLDTANARITVLEKKTKSP